MLQKKLTVNWFFLIALIISSTDSHALRQAKSTAIDERIKVMVYNPNDVFKFTGLYGYQSSIEFADGETIDTISMGDSLSWQIVPATKRLFLKPMEADATTNMTVLTNKRTYFFELHAKEPEDINDPDMVFVIRFIYPDETGNGGIRTFATSKVEGPNIEDEPENYNFNFSISGDNKSSPTTIFDDGEFTYFEFKNQNAEIPAFFEVDKDGNESLVNYSLSGKYVVVQRVSSRFTLRNGSDITCVFNENAITQEGGILW